MLRLFNQIRPDANEWRTVVHKRIDSCSTRNTMFIYISQRRSNYTRMQECEDMDSVMHMTTQTYVFLCK